MRNAERGGAFEGEVGRQAASTGHFESLADWNHGDILFPQVFEVEFVFGEIETRDYEVSSDVGSKHDIRLSVISGGDVQGVLFRQESFLHGKGFELKHKTVFGRNRNSFREYLEDSFLLGYGLSLFLAILLVLLDFVGQFLSLPRENLGLSSFILYENVPGHGSTSVEDAEVDVLQVVFVEDCLSFTLGL